MEQLTLTSQVKKETLGQKASSWKHRSVATARYTGKQLAWFVRLGGILVVTLLWGSAWVVNVRAEDRLAEALQMCVSKHPYVTKTVEIVTGATFSTLMEGAEVSGMDILAILTVADNVYNLSSIRLGRNLELRYKRESGELVGLEYQIDTEEMLYVTKDEDGWQAERKLIEYEVRLRTVEGAIESSLYIAALEQGLDDRAVVALADVFQWELDFSMDVQQGDGFKFIYEERFLAGRYIMPGRVLAAKFINSGESHYAFLFETTPGKEAHFNEQGESVQKMFLKAPVAFKYISSGFTTGLRYVEAFNVSTGHRAIDYAAPLGTPVRAVGDGTVVRAGWNGAYGQFVSIRHNGTYTTNYAHLSRFAVSYGQKVSQGQTIGYVGSTGFSTGPHLHYEMVKNGVKINPLREDFPGIDPVPADQLTEYLKVVETWQPKLDQL